jgi:hypothetical protein
MQQEQHSHCNMSHQWQNAKSLLTDISMAEAGSKSSTANVVDGFSKRFNFLLDRARFPKKNRMTLGAQRFEVVPNTFGSWMKDDRIPGKHSTLLDITKALLTDIPGRYNTKAVVAWLLAGDAVPNPFEGDASDTLALVDLYLQVSEIAKREGLVFDKLPRDVRNLILKRVRSSLPHQLDEEGVKLDRNAIALVTAMLETAKTMKE